MNIFKFKDYKNYDEIYSLLENIKSGEQFIDAIKTFQNKNRVALILSELINGDEITITKDIKNVEYIELHDKKPGFILVTFTKPNGTKGKQEIKIGRLTQQLVGNGVKPEELEEFVKLMFALQSGEDPFIKLVEGDEIIYWYNEKNYAEKKGTLGNSCMKYSWCDKYLKFYSENCKGIVKLLIKTDENNKLVARALVWKTDDTIYMDRVYTIDNKDEMIFIKWGNDNNIKKYYPNYNIKISKNKIKWDEDTKMPYMDTFQYGISNGSYLELFSDEPKSKYYIFDSTNGGFTPPRDENGYDQFGYDENGYDKDGYDQFGYDRDGYDMNGYDMNGYDMDGYDEDGYDNEGNSGENDDWDI